MQCVDCVREQVKSAPSVRSVFGGRVTDGRPMVSYAIMAICALLYVGQLASDRVTDELLFAPVLGMEEPWRFLTAAFVHSPNSPLHIMFNMYALWFCGQYLEPLLGRARFLALYLISALGGSVAFEAFGAFQSPGQMRDMLWFTPTVGASGAVFGMFAAVVVLNRKLGRDTGPMLVMIGINAAIPFFVSNVAWQAHLGGAVIGAAVAAGIAWLGRERAQLQWAVFAGLTVLLVGAAIGLDAYANANLLVYRG